LSDDQSKPFDVFLSHAHVDADVVEKLGARLEDEGGLRVWLDKWVLVPGEQWEQGLAKALVEAGSCAVCIGSKTPAGWFSQEIQRALNRQAKEPSFRVIPVILPGGDPSLVGDFLELRTWVQFKDGLDDRDAFRRLVAGNKGLSPGREQHPTSKPPKQVFTVPLPENPFFTGREEVLEELKKTLDERGIAALTGLGGMGKTQTAAQYAHHHRKDYETVLWVRAESQETLFGDMAQLAGRLELPERKAKEQSVLVEAVQLWFEEHEGWLLVLDNVEDYSVVRDLARKASANGHHVVITTQSQALGQIRRQRLSPMNRDLGAVLLLRRANRIRGLKPARNDKKGGLNGTPEGVPFQSILGTAPSAQEPKEGLSAVDPKDAALAREISQEVGGLPLALDQAGAYLEETGCGLGDYLTLLRQRAKELLARRGGLDSDHLSVAATYLTSLGKLAKRNPAAEELLQACAFLVPDAIPEEIFTAGAANFGPVLGAAASDPIKWDEAIAAAFKFSLLERNPAQKLLAVHRMVQAVAKSGMSDEERSQWAEQVVRAVNAAFPKVEFEVWGNCERLVPSAQVCSALVDEYSLSISEATRLLNETGYYLHERARYAEAEPLYRRALAIDESSYGPCHPEVAIGLNNLAVLLKVTDRLGEAEPLYRRVLLIDEKALGPDHPDMADDLSNLASLLYFTNRLREAEPLMRRALAIDEKALGTDHPNVGICLNNLAQLLQATNRLGEAEPLTRRALAITEYAYGPDHPKVATCLNNLALLLKATNRLGDAEPLYRRALAIDEKALGPDHPNVAIRLNNLALLLKGTNRLDEAEPLMRRALAIDEKALGLDHQTVAIRLNNLALLLNATNRLSEAEPLMRRALAINEKSLGRDHPRTVTVRKNLAGLLRELGRDEEADEL
jgi:tetratricopeptide (TPR) repeat protein